MGQKETFINNAFITWFNSRYQELIAAALLKRWHTVDSFCQVGIAITAATSAISSWPLWTKPGMQIIWAIIGGVIALVAIGHKAIGVVDQVKTWSGAKKAFATLRNELETLRQETDMSFDQSAADLNKRYKEIRSKFEQEDSETPTTDWLLSDWLANSAKLKLLDSIEKTAFEEELKLVRAQYQPGGGETK